MLLDEIAAAPADRRKRAIVDLTARDHWNPLIQKIHKIPENPAFGLAAQSKQDHVVPGQDRIDDLRNNRFLVPHNSRKEGLHCLKFADEVGTHLILDRSCAISIGAEITRPQLTEFRRQHSENSS